MPNDYSKLAVHRDDNNNVITGARFPVREWTVGVDVEEGARKQLFNVANMPFIYKHIVALPDCHSGIGATVGSVIPTVGAICPSAVGVDIGCGVCVVKTTMKASQLPKSLSETRAVIEGAVPHGRTDNGGKNDHGAWGTAPDVVNIAWMGLEPGYKKIIAKHPKIQGQVVPVLQLGTLGSGNHCYEVTIDENEDVWFLLHSGSRGIGNRIGSYFTDLAKREMDRWFVSETLPDINLAFLPEGSEYFDDYLEAMSWAQNYAKINRELMMNAGLKAIKRVSGIPKFETTDEVIDCHHNYFAKESHFGKNIFVTRKGAIRARKGDLGVILGSMGTKSYIVSGLGNQNSFTSASHGAGRKMSRTQAKATFTLKDHREAVQGVDCRIDSSVLDETPGAYKDIGAVMDAQKDLVKEIHTLKQCICIKG